MLATILSLVTSTEAGVSDLKARFGRPLRAYKALAEAARRPSEGWELAEWRLSPRAAYSTRAGLKAALPRAAPAVRTFTAVLRGEVFPPQLTPALLRLAPFLARLTIGRDHALRDQVATSLRPALRAAGRLERLEVFRTDGLRDGVLIAGPPGMVMAAWRPIAEFTTGPSRGGVSEVTIIHAFRLNERISAAAEALDLPVTLTSLDMVDVNSPGEYAHPLAAADTVAYTGLQGVTYLGVTLS